MKINRWRSLAGNETGLAWPEGAFGAKIQVFLRGLYKISRAEKLVSLNNCDCAQKYFFCSERCPSSFDSRSIKQEKSLAFDLEKSLAFDLEKSLAFDLLSICSSKLNNELHKTV